MFSAAQSGSVPGSTATSLIQALRDDDPRGWERLVKLYSALVYAWCRRAGLEPEDAADVFQEVLRTVHRGLTKFHHDGPGDSFRGWLRTITRSRIQDHVRRNADQPRGAGGTDALRRLSLLPGSISTQFSGSEVVVVQPRLLQEACATVEMEFQPHTWRAFWLVTIEDRSPAEVGAELNMTPAAVHTAKWRVLRRLREFLRGLLD